MTKELSKEILEILRQDCRVDAEQIAVMINADPAEVAEEIKRLERDRVIVKYNAVVNMEKFDKDMVQALIEVRVTPMIVHFHRQRVAKISRKSISSS